MSLEGKQKAAEKMAAAGVSQQAIDVFAHYYDELASGATGLIREDSIEPLPDPPRLSELAVDPEVGQRALAQTVILKLNGGLGTSMGMDKAKSLLPVRSGLTFLDIIATQIRAARTAYDAPLPLLLMNSFRTQEDTLAAMAQHPDIPIEGLPLDFVQSQEPKLRVSDLTPIEWPANPTLEWCPPGHGDIYTSLLSTGLLDTLIDRGFRYASVSNSDNLGAIPDPVLAGWFADNGAAVAMEVCRRTAADRKGGHLALRRSDGRIILREVAQTDPSEMDAFTDEDRHRYFNTNSLWFDLVQLQETLTSRHGVLGLPLIRNLKTVDPADPSTPEVYQVETAMGAAIEVFPNACAITVERTRFLPVKTTNDLLLLRSDVYQVGDDGVLTLMVDSPPLIDLDERYYKRIGDFEHRFPAGPPSLRQASGLSIRGDWTFGEAVTVSGEGVLLDTGERATVPDQARV